MKVSLLTLSFLDGSEKSFRARYYRNSLIQFRIAFFLVAFLYGIFGYLDQLVAEEYERLFHLIRFGIVVPILVLVFIFSFSRHFEDKWQEILFVCTLVGGSGIAVMTILAPENSIYYAGLMLIFSAAYFFIKLRFFMASIAGWMLVLFFNIGIIFYSDTEKEVIISYNFFFVSANLIGMFGAYYIEYYTRKDFYLNQLLDQRNAEIEDANKELEKKVIERTEELLLAKEKAEENDRLKSAFLANMSHEIRTPLNSIIGFAELINDPHFEKEQQDEFAKIIGESGNNLLAVISNIMDISKIEAGQLYVMRREFSVNNLVKSIQREFSKKASQKGIDLKTNFAETEVKIYSDETKIRQIITNLLGNSLKFTDKGYIEVGFSSTNQEIQFYVKDTGIGIPINYHEKVFERFRQVETAFTRKYGGNGLGLAISKSLVEMLGGEIWMESEEGRGSTFYFTVAHHYA